MAAVRVVVGPLFILTVLLTAYLLVGTQGAGAAPSSQAPPETETDLQQEAVEELAFRLSFPAGWEVEIASPYEVSYSLDEEAGIFVSRFEGVSPDTPLDALLAITLNEVEREYTDFEEYFRGTGEVNGRPVAEAYFAGSVETDEGDLVHVYSRLMVVPGDEDVFLVMGLVDADGEEDRWSDVIGSMDTFRPEPSPAPGDFRVTDVVLASDVAGCDAYTEREAEAFAPGERMYILTELEGVTAEGAGQDQRLVFTVQELVLRDGDGVPFFEAGPIGPILLDAPDGFDNVCLWVWVDLDGGSPPGEAVAEVVLSDDVGQGMIGVIAPFYLIGETQDFQMVPPFGTPTPIHVGDEVEGTIAEGKAQAYSVELEEAEAYVIEVVLGTLMDSVLWVLDADGRELAFDDDSGRDFASRLTFTPEETGTYTIVVSGYGLGVGTYTLSVMELEDYVAGAQTIDVGESVEGDLEATGSDLYAVELEEGVSYVFTVDLGTLEDSTLTLLDSDVQELAYNDDYAGTLASQIEWTAEETGTYYLLVEGYEDAEGSYTLSVEQQ